MHIHTEQGKSMKCRRIENSVCMSGGVREENLGIKGHIQRDL